MTPLLSISAISTWTICALQLQENGIDDGERDY